MHLFFLSNLKVPFEVIVVDDFHSRTEFKALSRIPGIRYFKNTEQRGLAHWNIGASESRSSYLALIGSPCILCKGSLTEMTTLLDIRENVGSTAPMIVVNDGSVWNAGNLINDELLTATLQHSIYPDSGEYKATRRVDYCLEDLILTRKKALSEVGGFSTNYITERYIFMDYGLKLKKRGYATFVLPNIHVLRRNHANNKKTASSIDYKRLYKDWEDGYHRLYSNSPESIVTDIDNRPLSERPPGKIGCTFAHLLHRYSLMSSHAI